MSSLKKIDKNENNKYKGKIKCDECNSMNTLASNRLAVGSMFSFAIFCMASVIFIFIPFIGFIIMPICILGSVISIIGLIISPFTKNYTLVCQDCKTVYTIDKKEYMEITRKS